VRIVEGFSRAQSTTTAHEAAALVREYCLLREALQPEHLTSAEVWDALLGNMPMTALIRNLATMTRVGLLENHEATARVVAQLGDADRLRRARVHPDGARRAPHVRIRPWRARSQRVASGTCSRGRARCGVLRVVRQRPGPGKRLLLALDVSGSMTGGSVAGVPGLSPRDASAALALVTASVEEQYEIVGFYAGRRGWKTGAKRHAGRGEDGTTPLAISPRQRLDDAVDAVSGLPFAGTDCSLPMLYARKTERAVDTFVVFTDSETWAGDIHPADALRDYRRASGINARLVVVDMVSNGFSIADPADAGMLDVVGFDTATPQLISDFARGAL
jgi:60 kDa SS-A/Ro ribonucleoprotein